MDTISITTHMKALQSGIIGSQRIKKLLLSLRIKELRYSGLGFQISHRQPINSLDIDCSGRFLLSGGQEKSLYIHDLHYKASDSSQSPTCNIVQRFMNNSLRSGYETVQWYPFDSGMILTSGMDKMLQVWAVSSKQVVETILIPGKIYQHHIGPVPSTTQCLVAVASSSPKVKLVDLNTGTYTHELEGHEHGVLCCQWSPVEEHLLATGGLDSAILLWDVRFARSCLASLDRTCTSVSSRRREKAKVHKPYVNAIKFSVDGKILISTGSDNELLAWHMTSLQNMRIPFEQTVENRRKRASSLQAAGIGNFDVLIAPSDNTIKFFHIQTGKLLNNVTGHFSSVTSCVYQKDRMEVISAGLDRQIFHWAPNKRERRDNEDFATQHLSPELDDWG